MKSFTQWLGKIAVSILFCFPCVVFAADSVQVTPAPASSPPMVYGPFQFEYTIKLPFNYWAGGNAQERWVAYMASCPPGTTVAGISVSQFKDNAVACGCGNASRCIPPYLTSMHSGGAGVQSIAVCRAKATGWVPKAYLSTVGTVGGFNIQDAIITNDPSGNSFYYTLDNNMMGPSGTTPSNSFPGFLPPSDHRTLVATGHDCQHP